MADVQVLTTTGKDIGLSDTTMQAFKESLRGNLLCRGEPGYDPARKVFRSIYSAL